MSKEEFAIGAVDKPAAATLLDRYHYLSGVSKTFRSGFNVGLRQGEKLCGVCIFTPWSVPELVKGCFGLKRDDQAGFFELSRLVLDPSVQQSEHNLASWFVSRSIRSLRAANNVRAVLSYADGDFHQGTVYAASNFTYYGLTDPKKDFWVKRPNGGWEKHSRGRVSGLDGEWRPRSKKHRFLLKYDKTLTCLWEEKKWAFNKQCETLTQ